MIQSEPFEIRDYADIECWDAFVADHPKGHVFHSTDMIRVFQNTLHHYPYAIGAVDECGKLLAILVAVEVRTLGRLGGSFASRSIHFAEPIYADGAAGRTAVLALLAEHDRGLARRVLFTEVRPNFAIDAELDPLREAGYERLGYLNYEADLQVGEEQLWKRLNGKCRNRIRTSFRRGVKVEQVDLRAHMSDAYELFAFSHAHSQVPLADMSLFEAAMEILDPSMLELYVAKHEGRIKAASLFLLGQGRVSHWYAGALRVYGVAPMACILWEAMSAYSTRGLNTFDFCGAGWEGEDYGPGRFKSKFGGRKTNHRRYRKILHPWKMRFSESAYSVMRGVLAPKSKYAED